MIIGQPIRTVPPTALALSLAEAKAWLRFDESAEDAVIAGLIRSATEEVEQYTGLSLITSTWTQTFSEFTSPMRLGRRPLRTVSSVAYLDTSGAAQTVGTSTYRVVGVGGDIVPGAVRLANSMTWPDELEDEAEAVTVTFTAGFGTSHNDVPELIRQAVAMTVATRFGFREDITADVRASELPYTSRNMLRPWRPLAVA